VVAGARMGVDDRIGLGRSDGGGVIRSVVDDRAGVGDPVVAGARVVADDRVGVGRSGGGG